MLIFNSKLAEGRNRPRDQQYFCPDFGFRSKAHLQILGLQQFAVSSICWARILDLAYDKVWIVDLSGCQKYFVLFVLCGCVKLPEVAQSCLKSPDSTQVALTHVKLSLMFLCICSVCNRSQWCQNMIRTKKWHMMGSWPCHWRSYHIFISSVISNFAHPQQFRIYFFCTMKDQKIVNDDIIYASVSH